jgi:mannose-6-phosphate isomerase
MNKLYPLTFDPAYKDYVWGGRSLKEHFGRNLPPGITAESWEIAAHHDGVSVVNNGFFAGISLTDLHDHLGYELIGRNSAWAQERGKFPLLIKLLDARNRLSVQVHPDDAYALENENNELGKTEMWVVLHAESGAAILLGVKDGTTPNAFKNAIQEQRLEPFLHQIKVRTGDFICVPSRSLHAILGGLVVAEIQQNSNVTYRVYDWGRDRPLHVGKALDVINFQQVEPKLSAAKPVIIAPGITEEQLCQNKYFTVERLNMKPGSQYTGNCNGKTLEIWGVISGRANILGGNMEVPCPAVTFALLPAAMGPYKVHAHEETQLLRAFVEDN